MSIRGTCNTCDHTGGNEFRTPEGTCQCPQCGSADVRIEISFSESIAMHESLGTKARHEGEKRPFRETSAGDDLRRSDGKWMEKHRVIDRDGDLYEERVVDPDTGEVVHECAERLSEHRGHGTRPRQHTEHAPASPGKQGSGA